MEFFLNEFAFLRGFLSIRGQEKGTRVNMKGAHILKPGCILIVYHSSYLLSRTFRSKFCPNGPNFRCIQSYVNFILQPGDFVHTLGDAHVYLNHVEALKIQVKDSKLYFQKMINILLSFNHFNNFLMHDKTLLLVVNHDLALRQLDFFAHHSPMLN